MCIQSPAERERRHDALIVAGNDANEAQVRIRTRAHLLTQRVAGAKVGVNQRRRKVSDASRHHGMRANVSTPHTLTPA